MSAKESIKNAYNLYSGFVILFMLVTIISEGLVVSNLIDNREMQGIDLLRIFVKSSMVIVFIIQFCVYRKLKFGVVNERYKGCIISFIICSIICILAMWADLAIAGAVSDTRTVAIYGILRFNVIVNLVMIPIALINGSSIKKYIAQEYRTLEMESEHEKITR